MKIVILGCGRQGSTVASDLAAQGHDVCIIDMDSTQFWRLGPDYKGRKVVGNGTEQDTLRRAGIESADVFLAITQGDNRNIMASEIARVLFNVPQVHTRIKDPQRAECFAQQGLLTFCTTVLASAHVEQAILSHGNAQAPGPSAPPVPSHTPAATGPALSEA